MNRDRFTPAERISEAIRSSILRRQDDGEPEMLTKMQMVERRESRTAKSRITRERRKDLEVRRRRR